MAVIYYQGTVEDEQAKGAVLDAGVMQAYAIRSDKNTELIYLGGHHMEDAPTYNTTEGRILPIRKHLGGRNVVEEQQLTPDVVKSVVFNLLLPHRAISVTDRLYQSQKNCKYNVAFAPDTCDDVCDSFFWVAKEVVFGAKQLTSTILGYDENGNPITNMRTLRATGNLLGYYGLRSTLLTPAEDEADLYAVDIVEQRCEGCDCPYQNLVRAGDGIVEVSADGGTTWTALDVTAVTADLAGFIANGVKYVDGNYVITYSDAVPVATDGGAAYSTGGGAFVLSTFDVAPAAGLTGLVKAFGKLYAFGPSGSLYVSCDSGISFTQVLTPFAVDVYAAAYDKNTGLLVLGGEDNLLYTFDGVGFNDISAAVNWPLAGSDVTSVANFGPGNFAIGTADGLLAEHGDIESASADNQFVTSRSLGATPITAIVGDTLGARLLWAEDGANTVIQLRDVFTRMAIEGQHTFIGAQAINASVAGNPLLDEGTNFFIFVGAGGVTLVVSACGICLSGDCT